MPTAADRLPRPLPEEETLRLLGRLAHGAGADSYLVGGPVRDILLGRSSPDFDIAIEGDPRRVGTELQRHFGGRFVYHARFRTGTARLPGGGHIDIARARTETYARPAVLPTVKPAPIAADLVRRDFTVNALALDLTPGRFARLLDPHSGRDDIARRLVRVLHPDSFRDDPTRIFRAIRFAVRLEFDIEPETLALMRAGIAAGLPALLTPERVLYELRCFCAEELAPRMFEAAMREDLLAASFSRPPARGFLAGLQRLGSRRAGPETLFIHLLSALPDDPRFPVTRGEREAARAVRVSGPLRARLARVKTPAAIYRLLRPLPAAALPVIGGLSSPAGARAVEYYVECLAGIEPLLSSRDLKALGLRPGPAFARVIELLRAARLNGRTRTREDELALARRLIAKEGS